MDLTINDQRLRFSTDPKLIKGSTSVIIFLHDSLGCIELWRKFPNKIGELTGCNVISYDRLGYGKSSSFSYKKRGNDYLKEEAEILGEIIKTLDLKQVILFGHSDGGSIALLTASLFPDKIAGVITEGAHVFVEKETVKGIQDAVVAYRDTNLKEKLTKYHGDKTDDVFRMWTETWLSEDYQSWNIEHYLPNVQCRSLIIQGENDEYGSLDQVHAITQNTTGISKALIIPDIGHTPHKENTALVLEESSDFILSIMNHS
ncbi:alpha/beta hydrolase [Aquimarina sp. D1M17]|uniref:alpha/beta fold hydrolase n=1 Tax=Aquimarina acroporae TaxID=2937283 RepID=UPI0020BE8A70|nr:alpha/beta hydrolase [Aquimarina acroporae]MCK8520518.1 alpha/beta hydrolase [Aquimarina acroporae]